MRTVEENNKLIIDFLEVEYSSNDDTYFLPSFGFMNVRGEFQTDFTIGKLKFHSDWNWLMEVVEKINNTGRFEVVIQKRFCYISDESNELTLSCPASSTFKAVYQAVVEFINFYNQQ